MPPRDTTINKEFEAVRAMMAGQNERLSEVRESMAVLQARLEAVSESLERMSGENGMPRCARQEERISELARGLERLAGIPGRGKTCVEHTERLGFLEHKLDTLCGRLWWFAGSVSLAVISLGIRIFWMSLVG